MPESKVTVYEALRGAVGALSHVDKDGYNKNQSFAFRSIEGTVAATRTALLENNLSLIPSFSLLGSSDWDRGPDKAPMHRTEILGTFRVVGPGGDSFEFTTVGEAVDYEGRSANKAMSAATKNALPRLLQIGSGDDGDATSQHPAQSPRSAQPSPTGGLAATVAGVASTVTANQQTGEIRGITEGQGKNLYRLWKHKLSWDRDRFFQEIEIVTGAQVTDDRDLTFDQASAMIKALKLRAGEDDTPYQPQQGPSPREQEPDYDDSIFQAMVDTELPEFTYLKIESNMRRVLNRMDEVTKLFAASSEKRARASAAYDVAKSSARLERRYQPHAEGAPRVTEQVADDHATLATEDERLAYEIAKAENEAAKQSLLTCRAQLDGLRSLMSSYRLQDGGS